jgi:very-short-patch-repair endonuclease
MLRRGQLDGWHFRRQQVIDGFIVDFFCARLRLVIELDGAVHDDPEVVKYDEWRDDLLTSRGLRVIRIRNVNVNEPTLRREVEARATELGLRPPSPDRERGTGGEAGPATAPPPDPLPLSGEEE